MTIIFQLKKEKSFGEVSFFSERRRTCTARSSDYTDCLLINRDDFLQIAYEYPEAI